MAGWSLARWGGRYEVVDGGECGCHAGWVEAGAGAGAVVVVCPVVVVFEGVLSVCESDLLLAVGAWASGVGSAGHRCRVSGTSGLPWSSVSSRWCLQRWMVPLRVKSHQ